MGRSYFVLGDFNKAIEYSNRQLEIARTIGDWREQAMALGVLGAAYEASGKIGQAIEFHEQKREIAIQMGDRFMESDALAFLAQAYQASDCYPYLREEHPNGIM